ncbi:YtxH domain-containing protein [Acidobacteriia bacterium AH_259_A11_L15]|nr:YtxH domain-containing protein [Acidobacteriia bacterium AH_259_A11_L15]
MGRNGGSNFGYFLAGLGIGAVIGLLFAPRSGEETREYLRERAEGIRDDTRRRAREVRGRAEEYADRGKEFLDEKRESVEAALEAGKQAYRQEKRKM